MHACTTLVIETSTPSASVALVHADGRIESRAFRSDRSHNAMLFPPLKELLAGVEVGLVLVGSGPGSYSGTRVGIAAAQGVAMAMNCPAVAVPSLLAVAAAEDGAACLAIGDARRGSYWTARVEALTLREAPTLCGAEELADAVAAALRDGVAVFSFEETGRFPLGENAGRADVVTPDATRLWKAWLAADDGAKQAWSAEIPQPIYLKPPHITPGRKASMVNA